MDNPLLTQRQRWFSYFPEGSIEFLLLSRVLALLLLLSLAIVTSIQRPAVLVALTGVIWLDYVLTIWWAIQIAADREELLRDPTAAPQPDDSRRRRRRTLIWACLPATVVAVAVAPWPAVLKVYQPGLVSEATFARVGRPALALAYLVLLMLGTRALVRVRLGPIVWSMLILVPILHWLALHRLLGVMRARLHELDPGEQGPVPGGRQSNAAVAVATVTWFVGVLPWAVIAAVTLVRDQFPSAFFPFCGTLLTAVFAIADLAALEQVQRQFVSLLRKR